MLETRKKKKVNLLPAHLLLSKVSGVQVAINVPPSKGNTRRPCTASSSCPVRAAVAAVGCRSWRGCDWGSLSTEHQAARRLSQATNPASKAFPLRAHSSARSKPTGKQVTERQRSPPRSSLLSDLFLLEYVRNSTESFVSTFPFTINVHI